MENFQKLGLNVEGRTVSPVEIKATRARKLNVDLWHLAVCWSSGVITPPRGRALDSFMFCFWMVTVYREETQRGRTVTGWD